MTPEAVTSLAPQYLPEVGGGPLNKAEPAFSLATGESTVVATLRPAAVTFVLEDAFARSIEVIRNRIDEAGVAEPSIQSMGRDRILVQIPGLENPAGLRSLLWATAELTFHRVVPSESDGAITLPEIGGTELSVSARPALDGERLIAETTTDTRTKADAAINRIWRNNEDGRAILLHITDAGLTAIGIEPVSGDSAPMGADAAPGPGAPKDAPTEADAALKARTPRAGTKQAKLIEMIRAEGGATIDEIVAKTGWQPHTARGAFAGALKKKLGLEVTSEKVEGRGRVYTLPRE